MFAENTCGVVSEPRMEIIEVVRSGGIGSQLINHLILSRRIKQSARSETQDKQ